MSSSEQARAEATSLDIQERRCRAYVEAQGWEFVESFVDPGISGSLALEERPDGKKLMAAADAGDIEVVVVLKVDRFTRNLASGSAAISRLNELGCGFVAVEESFDTTNPAGRMMLNLLMLFAAFEAERIKDRMESGRRAKAERSANDSGLARASIGGLLPLGLTTDEDGHIIEDVEHSPTVRRIFELRAAGKSTLAIAETLQQEGHSPRPRGGAVYPFSDEMVLKILKTTAYVSGEYGRRVAKGEEPIMFAVPSLVSPDLWKTAQADRSGRRRLPKNAGRKVNEYGLPERMKHLHGDGSVSGMFGHTYKTAAGLTRWYRCTASRKSPTAPATCDGFGVRAKQVLKAVSADLVEARFLLWALDTVEDPETLAQYAAHADRILLAEAGDSPEDIEAHRKRLERLEVKRSRYHDAFAADPSMTKDEFLANLGRLDAEAQTLQAAIDRAADVDDQRQALTASIAELLEMSIVATDERDPAADEVSPAQLRDELRQAANRSLSPAHRHGRTPNLPKWALEEVRKYAAAFGAIVTLTESDDPRRPDIRIEFSPTAPLQQAGVSSVSTW